MTIALRKSNSMSKFHMKDIEQIYVFISSAPVAGLEQDV